MAVSFACAVPMMTPQHLRLIAGRYDRTLALRALALPNLAAYTLTVWVRIWLFRVQGDVRGGCPPNPGHAAAANSVPWTLTPPVRRACYVLRGCCQPLPPGRLRRCARLELPQCTHSTLHDTPPRTQHQNPERGRRAGAVPGAAAGGGRMLGRGGDAGPPVLRGQHGRLARANRQPVRSSRRGAAGAFPLVLPWCQRAFENGICA
jgi:hypothetical protein